MKTTIICGLAALALALLTAAAPASAQATRTWVSGVGDDANPCSRVAPCKTFAGAISKTIVNGEIDCLDPGGFGALTITKAITIDCTGTYGSVLVSGTNGIIIAISGTVGAVNIRGVAFQGIGQGLDAIKWVGGGKSLHVENVIIRGFTGHGVEFAPTSSADLFLRNVQIDDVGQGGVDIAPGAGASTEASIDGSRFDNDGAFGVRVTDRGFATVSKSIASRNTDGFSVVSTATNAAMTIYDSETTGNAGSGLKTTGPSAAIFMSNVVIAHNSTRDITGNVQTWQNNFAISNAGANPTSGNLTPK
jgi:hypothetical protein